MKKRRILRTYFAFHASGHYMFTLRSVREALNGPIWGPHVSTVVEVPSGKTWVRDGSRMVRVERMW